jgi:hypothetical protein
MGSLESGHFDTIKMQLFFVSSGSLNKSVS